MKHRRPFLQVGLASLARVALDRSEASAASGAKYRFQFEGEQEKVLSAGDVFYEAPGNIHLPSGNASITKPARILALACAEKGKEITNGYEQ